LRTYVPQDPFFISYGGKGLDRQYLRAIVARYGEKAGIVGVRCSPHTLRHTGAKRFILVGGDLFRGAYALARQAMPR
jgi:integrase/recombinase XerD